MTVVRRQGIKNTAYTYIGIVLGIISTLYIQPFFLSKEQIGITRLVISLSTIFASVSSLSITSITVKFLPLYYDIEKKHNNFFTIVILFPLIGFLLFLTLAILFEKNILNFYGKNADIIASYFFPIMLIAFLNSIVFSFTAYCNAINKSSISTFINEILNRAGFIICILLFSYGLTTQNTYIFSLSIIYFIQLVLLFAMITYFDHPTFNFTFFSANIHLKEILRFGLISSFMQITGVCMKFIDVNFVARYESLEQLGIYSIAAFIGLVIETPLSALEKIAGTKIAKLFAQNNLSEIEKIYKLSSKYLMIFCGLLASVLIVCIKPLLSLLPHDYSSGAIVTIIICLGAFINSASGVNYSIITYSNYYKLGAIFYSSLLVVTIILNILLIPRFGIMGAAIATCTASILHNLLRFIFIKIKLNMQPFTKDNLKVLAIILLSIFLAFLIKAENYYLLILFRGTVTSATFITLLIVLKVFSIKEIKEELNSFKKTFI